MTAVEIISIIISTLSLLGLGFIMENFWRDRREKRQEKTEEAKKRAKKERQDEFREVLKPVEDSLSEISKKLDTDTTGTVTLLRDRMKATLDFCKSRGWASSSDKANWNELYNSYKQLGGNHFIEYVDQWKEEMRNLLTEDEYKAAKKANSKKKVLVEGK